jgi:hypothetical protein
MDFLNRCGGVPGDQNRENGSAGLGDAQPIRAQDLQRFVEALPGIDFGLMVVVGHRSCIWFSNLFDSGAFFNL